MAYYTKVLQPGEIVHFVGRPHWILYNRSFLFLTLGVMLFIINTMSYEGMDTSHVGPAALAGVVAILLSLVFFISSGIRRATTEIVVTDKRVIYKTGLIGRHTVEMQIGKIETVDIEQSIMGRILGFGTVLIRGTGAGIEPLRRVVNPLSLRNAILVG